MSLDKIKLDKKNKKFLYLQLYEKIKSLVLDGELKPETKLPTIRSLASNLNVNNVTVVNAYNKLEEEGYIYKKIGSGSFIKKMDEIYSDEDELEEDINLINFASTAPTTNLFPLNEIKESIIEVLEHDKSKAFTYQDPKGYLPLRKSLRDYLKTLGINTMEDNIQIISGAQQGIDIISKALVDFEDIVFTEEFTYTGAIGVFKSRGAETLNIKLDKDGINLEDLERKLKKMKPKLLYLMPNFHNPTGCSYTKEKMSKILELARKYEFYIIEDDYLSDLDFQENRNITMKSLDLVENERVIYIKSFSKLFMPGLRIAFIVMPEELLFDINSAKHISDISTPGLIQRAFNIYIRKGEWNENLKRINKVYKLRHEIMTKAIEKYLPENIEYWKTNGGFNFWFKLPKGQSSDELYEYLLKENILIAPGRIFSLESNDNEYFRLSVTSIDSEKIEESFRKFANELGNFFQREKKSEFSIEDYSKFL